MPIKHYRTCTADYPEKDPNEAPHTDIALGDGTAARTCNDCGAFEIVPVAAVRTAHEILQAMMDCTEEQALEIANMLGPCAGTMAVLDALRVLRELKKVSG